MVIRYPTYCGILTPRINFVLSIPTSTYSINDEMVSKVKNAWYVHPLVNFPRLISKSLCIFYEVS